MARPRRTCVGCRTTADKDELVRLVARPSVAVDLPQRASGRGAYLHPGPECLALAIRRRAVPRALRTSGFDPDDLLRQWQQLDPTSGGLA
ncbi:YlxR family protein [uncultured Friedmanniella sp.]|uniref:YlxR family protein n=1 Tax=uncultured Friedmanniella sp. TaxID=335381 RepID=UPI0035CA9470